MLITLHTEALWGNGGQPISPNSFTGAISPENFDAAMPVFDKNSIAQSEFYITLGFSEHFAVMLGQIDGTSLAALFPGGNATSQFKTETFVQIYPGRQMDRLYPSAHA